MNVCVLSMQRVNNFGSLLQAYSLKKILEELGHKVYFIDIEKNDEDNQLINGKVNKFSKEREGESNSILSKISKIDRYTFNRLATKRQNREQNLVFEYFRDNFLEMNKKIDEYDVCVIGSDEVFNCLGNNPWGFTTQLFGNVNNAKKVITYAACCGATEFSSLPIKVMDKIKNSFNNISAFSVRDENTRKFVNSLSDKKVTLNLDPVVVGDFEKEIKEVEERALKKLPNKYCIIYSYHNRIHDKLEIKTIQKFCKQNKLKPITIGAPQFWVKEHVVLDPFEMLVAFKNANFIITDTFHGTIFASKYSKKFATFVRASNKNKLSDLVNRLNVTDNLMENINELEQKFEIINDVQAIRDISNEQNLITKNYLKENL